MKHFQLLFIAVILLAGCSTEEASHYERTQAEFLDSLGSDVSGLQWWRTAVTLRVNVASSDPVKLWLLSSQSSRTYLYDYKELAKSGTVTMTAPQGQGNTLILYYTCNGKANKQAITLSGKPEETVSINTNSSTRAPHRYGAPPASLCGNSIWGNAEYYEFSRTQMEDFYHMMDLVKNNDDAKTILNLNCNYELESNGPFSITWVNGYEGDQDSRILGYYYHSATTWDDIKYVDLSETHKWDYIDGLAKVQYQINRDDVIDGHEIKANTWYDANFDLSDKFGATWCYNPDRVGDNAYNSQEIYYRYENEISALRGISFEIDVPVGMRIGFYLRADEKSSYPEQYEILQSLGIKPYTSNSGSFKGTCFCVEEMNIEGNGRGKHRSFIKDYEEVIWMGMEDLVDGGDHDCNDVIFGVVSDLSIWMPTIVSPELKTVEPGPGPGPEPEPEPENTTLFPWTIAFEDVNRDPDFDFNDAVIKVIPDYERELCCVTVMAAGSNARMYLHYDGPDGDQTLGEIHELMGQRDPTFINTKGAVANYPFVTVDCVPWPTGYTMANDAKRFYIEIQRGTCGDCTDVITLPMSPGQMPEAVVIAGDWNWPQEGSHIFNTYDEFPNWAQDVTRTRYWEWYKSPSPLSDSYVTY